MYFCCGDAPWAVVSCLQLTCVHMLAAGAFRWHCLSKVSEELMDMWVLKLEQWYIRHQEGLNQLDFKVFLQNGNEGLLPFLSCIYSRWEQLLMFCRWLVTLHSEAFLAVNCLATENAKNSSPVGFARNSFGNSLSYCSDLLFARTGTFGILNM